MRIAAVLTHYWEKREENIFRQIKDLKAGTQPPDEIVLISNNPRQTFREYVQRHFPDVLIVEFSKNQGHMARFFVGQMLDCDYLFFLDDDMTVGKKTLDELDEHAGYMADYVFGTWGKTLGKDGGYMTGQEYRSSQVLEGTVLVDVLIGKGGIFCSRLNLQKIIEEHYFLTKESSKLTHHYGNGREIDLLVGLAMGKGFTFVPYLSKEAQLVELDEYGVGYRMEKSHYSSRDAFCKAWKEEVWKI